MSWSPLHVPHALFRTTAPELLPFKSLLDATASRTMRQSLVPAAGCRTTLTLECLRSAPRRVQVRVRAGSRCFELAASDTNGAERRLGAPGRQLVRTALVRALSVPLGGAHGQKRERQLAPLSSKRGTLAWVNGFARMWPQWCVWVGCGGAGGERSVG